MSEQNGDAPRLTHYLLSITGRGEPVNGVTLALELGKTLEGCGIEIISARTYISSIFTDPSSVGLKDQWLALSPGLRKVFRNDYPALALSIELICGVTKEELDRHDSVFNGAGLADETTE